MAHVYMLSVPNSDKLIILLHIDSQLLCEICPAISFWVIPVVSFSLLHQCTLSSPACPRSFAVTLPSTFSASPSLLPTLLPTQVPPSSPYFWLCPSLSPFLLFLNTSSQKLAACFHAYSALSMLHIQIEAWAPSH